MCCQPCECFLKIQGALKAPNHTASLLFTPSQDVETRRAAGCGEHTRASVFDPSRSRRKRGSFLPAGNAPWCSGSHREAEGSGWRAGNWSDHRERMRGSVWFELSLYRRRCIYGIVSRGAGKILVPSSKVNQNPWQVLKKLKSKIMQDVLIPCSYLYLQKIMHYLMHIIKTT